MSAAGVEPSGKPFNAIVCLPDKRPHNCCVNVGAIMTAAVLVGPRSLVRAARSGRDPHVAAGAARRHWLMQCRRLDPSKPHFARSRATLPQAAGHPGKSAAELAEHLMDTFRALCGNIDEVPYTAPPPAFPATAPITPDQHRAATRNPVVLTSRGPDFVPTMIDNRV